MRAVLKDNAKYKKVIGALETDDGLCSYLRRVNNRVKFISEFTSTVVPLV
jgi:hypothetical protein